MLLCATAWSAPDQSLVLGSFEEFALHNQGDAGRGFQIFTNEQAAACARCHTTDGSAGKAGPDLFAIGDKFSRRDLIRSILEPSAVIAIGYDTTSIETKSDEEISGIIKQATDSWVELMGWDAKLFRFTNSDVAMRRTSSTSFMPVGNDVLKSPQELADLVAYLETLHQPIQAMERSGMPVTIPQAMRGVELRPFFGTEVKLDHPVWFGQVPGFTNRFVVLEHGGKSWVIERTVTHRASEPVEPVVRSPGFSRSGERRSPSGEPAEAGTPNTELVTERQSALVDLSKTVRVGGATGLLGLAFHPKFAENRRYFLKYQILENNRIYTLLVERRFAEDFRGDSGEPARELLRIQSVTQDHNGGSIEFGPDGFLYLGMGDTGPQRDPQGHGQDRGTLLGKMLRIDVDGAGDGRAYAIPATNPFRQQTNARPEIWASGFREPWRFSFDSITGDLWVGDVGQDQYEEVAIVRAGENHGWNVFEGVMPYSDRYRRDGENYITPVLTYSHREGVSVTGGYVYRGTRAPEMVGRYICGDFESRRIWALTQTNRELAGIVEIGRAPTRIVSFAQDFGGELYLVGYDNGVIYQMDLAGIDPTPVVKRVLAETSERTPVRWRYTLQAPADGWFQAHFDDSKWNYAPGGFGTRGTPGAVVRSEWNCDNIWLRREFALDADAAALAAKSLVLRIHHDEDVEVFLNGVEAARLPRWTSGYVEVPLASEAARALRPGRNVMAIRCRQNSGGQYIDAGLMEYGKPTAGMEKRRATL